MDKPSFAFLKKEANTYLLLFFCSLAIYFIYFSHIFLNINSLLSSITGDSIKNYYTYAYHIKNDPSLINFAGMNFPFGEHVVYTDCQPLLTFILKCVPFPHNYLIGILHTLIYLSFIITPLILFRIFRKLKLDKVPAFFFALGISLLSPQFAKINGGHHGLAYGCMIPLSILFILNFLREPTFKQQLVLLIFNFLLFLIHPYLGFGTSLLTFITLFINALYSGHIGVTGKRILTGIFTGLGPIILFKIFMFITDKHENRPTEPYGNETLVENWATILSPDFGPFKEILENIFGAKIIHYEGHSYIGSFTIVSALLLFAAILIKIRDSKLSREPVMILITCFILLLLSFGMHNLVTKTLHIQSASLNQFRAVCRFAWFFYFALPIFLFTCLDQNLRLKFNKKGPAVMVIISVIYFSFQMMEAHYYFKKDSAAFWKFRNFFNEKQLTKNEKDLFRRITLKDPQAIIPLPLFILGSEMYDRVGGDNSMVPSLLISYHTSVPVMGTWLSRTSMTETRDVIQLINQYKKNKQAATLLDERDFLILKTKDEMLPDEERLLERTNEFYNADSLELRIVSPKGLLNGSFNDPFILNKTATVTDSNIRFVNFEEKKPFTTSNFQNYETIYVLDSNSIIPGRYVVSLHFHFDKPVYRSLACNLIITRGKGKEYEWRYVKPMSVLSGFYEGYGVSEYFVDIENGCRYEFVIKGEIDQAYQVSDFLLRPAGKNVMWVSSKGDTIRNNYAP